MNALTYHHIAQLSNASRTYRSQNASQRSLISMNFMLPVHNMETRYIETVVACLPGYLCEAFEMRDNFFLERKCISIFRCELLKVKV